MAYIDTETSLADSQPEELYDFACGADHWRKTSAAYDIVFDGETYEAAPGLRRKAMRRGRNALDTTMDILLPWSDDFVRQYIPAPIDGLVTLTSYRQQGADYAIAFDGRVVGVDFGTDRVATIQCRPGRVDLTTGGMALRFGRSCGVALYSDACGLDQADYKATGTLDTVDGVTLTSDVFYDLDVGYLIGGWLSANNYSRKIVNHIDHTVTLIWPIPDLVAGMPWSAYAGCDHLWSSGCAGLSNRINCRAFPFLPSVNPFGAEGIR